MAIRPQIHGLHQRGYTLVELIIAMALLTLLVVGGTTLGRSWVTSSHATNAENQLLQGYKLTRATALINKNAVTGTTAAASLTIGSGTISVTDSSNSTIYRVSLPADTTVTLTCGSTLALNNNAVPTAAACQSSLAYTISVTGGSNVTGTLY